MDAIYFLLFTHLLSNAQQNQLAKTAEQPRRRTKCQPTGKTSNALLKEYAPEQSASKPSAWRTNLKQSANIALLSKGSRALRRGPRTKNMAKEQPRQTKPLQTAKVLSAASQINTKTCAAALAAS